MSNELERHERYKQYSINAYNIGNSKFPVGTKILGIAENPKTGFSGYVLQENNQIIIVYKGTDLNSVKDVMTDVNMAFKKRIPAQAGDALEVYDRVKQTFPNIPITVVGHSLGGSLAQYVAIMRIVNEAVTFNPVGVGKSMYNYLSKYGSKTSENRIINYNNPDDNITKFFRGELYGTNYAVYEIDKSGSKHSLENMKPLTTRQKLNTGYSVKSEKPKNCVGSYPVQSYTRADGTEVKGYTRTCGAKHSGNDRENIMGNGVNVY